MMASACGPPSTATATATCSHSPSPGGGAVPPWRFRGEHPVLSVGPDGEPLDPGEERHGAAHAAVVGGGEIVVAEHDAAGPEHGPRQVDVGPRRVEVVPGVHLDEVRVHAPPAQRRQRRRRGERQRQHARRAGGGDVGHELRQEQRVPVPRRRDVAPEPVPERRPPAEVVDAEDRRGEREVPRDGRHVQRRRAQERAELDDHRGAHRLDELREHGPRRAPPARARPRRVQQRRRVRRREPRVGALAVEQLVEQRRDDGVARQRLPALLPEPEQVVRRRPRIARRRGVRSRDGGEVRGVRPRERRLGRPRRRAGGGGGEEAEGVADGEDDEEGGEAGEVRPEHGRHGGSG
ncbi:unnamed protein product [Urochloa decumbens]|uniref:Uncharacterized protein n=1 Tax=Urochloa decumbens TaxID=240449 RepID=A0ABC9FDQ2_9POAL